ncbi:hypothetical protein [Paraferrimonas sp. SM1919]|uniref:hypothetical protein n=1 Tax=Paraferrimonas sp. SM1919 TaxID=2662263 RepID=UPI0013D75DBC|nr:hypothetical protein [Paraferrimonas sp. SM1919]
MAQSFVRNGPDKLQKLFLYLIVLDYGLLFWLMYNSNELRFATNIAVALLLVAYNLLLTQLSFRRARRQSDYYILYPILGAGLLSLGILIKLFIFY